MIIIEGPDGAGKSTLSEYLSRIMGIPRHHSGGPPRNTEEILERQRSITSSLASRKVTIFDRIPAVSDVIYGPIIRGGSPLLEFAGRRHKEAFKREVRVPIVYCRPPLPVLMGVENGHEVKAHETVEHVEGVKKNVLTIVRRYDQLIAEYPHITYDFTGQGSSLDLSQLVEFLLHSIRECNENIPFRS